MTPQPRRVPDAGILAVIQALARRQAKLDYAAAEAQGSAPMSPPPPAPAARG